MLPINDALALIQAMAFLPSCNKPLPKPMMRELTHIRLQSFQTYLWMSYPFIFCFRKWPFDWNTWRHTKYSSIDNTYTVNNICHVMHILHKNNYGYIAAAKYLQLVVSVPVFSISDDDYSMQPLVSQRARTSRLSYYDKASRYNCNRQLL